MANIGLRHSDVFENISKMKYIPRWTVLLMDMFICIISLLFCLWVGNHIFCHNYMEFGYEFLFMRLGSVIAIQMAFFWIFRTYSGILRFSTFIDTIKVVLAVGCATVCAMLLNCISEHFGLKVIPYSILLFYCFVSIVLLSCFRVAVKTIFEVIQKQVSGAKPVLIYGTKSAGIAIAKMLRSSADSQYRPVGYISDDPHRKVYDINGLHVYTLDNGLFKFMKRRNIQDVIVSPIKMKDINPSKDLQIFLDNDIHILTTPMFKSYNTTEGDIEEDERRKAIGRIESIQIEDLLERPTINIDTENVRHAIENNIVMVTGAAGSIGSELVNQVLKYAPRMVVLFEQAESALHDLRLDLRDKYPDMCFTACIGDVRNRDRVEEVIKEYQPKIIFHAAAYKHVPLMEEHPNEAIMANVMGTKNMADMAVKYGVERFIMISTDKAVNPTNVMGASKRIAEIYVQSLYKHLVKTDPNCTKFITTRFGNVLGSNGSVIPYFKKQIAAGGPVTVTHRDIIRYFMTIPEACTLVMEAATLGNGGEIFVFDMGHPVKIYDLAKNMIRLAGFVPEQDIPIVFTGLRPGEKLYEELLNMKETTMPTTNEKIMIAKVREFEFSEVEANINELIESSKTKTAFSTVAKMKQIVPEYKSKNSVYEQLDK